MSKKCKTASKLARVNAKRARKAANKALYEGWRNSGRNQKSARDSGEKKDSVRCFRTRVRTKLYSDVKARDGTFLTMRQAHNQMSLQQILNQG